MTCRIVSAGRAERSRCAPVVAIVVVALSASRSTEPEGSYYYPQSPGGYVSDPYPYDDGGYESDGGSSRFDPPPAAGPYTP